MTQNYELIVKGIRNFENKVTVTLALRDKKRFDGEIFDLDISLDRVEGAALEFYEAAARRSIRQVFLDVAAGLCEGDEQSPEKRSVILDAQNVWITYKGKLPGRITCSLKMPPSTLRSEKDDVESRIEKLESYVVELNKKWSILVPSGDEKQFAAFDDYCRKVMSRNLAECFSIHNDNFSDPEWECNRPSFVVSGDAGKITISENGKVTPPSHQYSEELIEFAIDYLKNNKKQGLMKRVGRCMGYLQVAAEIEALASGADKDAIVREALLRDFNTPPFKKGPAYWLHPGLTYLKVRI
ncbi:YdfR family protein [Escherichia coli]|nr:YdfR family protein [Escherichia coli]